MFIAIEGIDGCGKSTQIELLSKKLNAAFFHFPNYETPIGQLILSHLKEEWSARHEGFTMPSLPAERHTDIKYVDALMFQAMQFANRLEKAEAISEALKTGHVIADRYIASGIVYGTADGLDPDYLERTQLSLKQPDFNILLDISAEESTRRRPERRDRYEALSGFLSKVASLYRDLWLKKRSDSRYGQKWLIIEGTQPVEKIYKDILGFCSVP